MEEAPATHERSTTPDAVDEHVTYGVDQVILSESDSCETEPHFHKDSDMMLEDQDEVSPISFPAHAEIRQSPAAPEDQKLHHSSSVAFKRGIILTFSIDIPHHYRNMKIRHKQRKQINIII